MKRKIAAIIAADVVGYSKLVALDEEETVSQLMTYRGHFIAVIELHGGRVFNTAGDAILAEFPSSVEAVRAVMEALAEIRKYNRSYSPNQKMKFRVGVTTGDVIEKDGDLFGDAINIAARLESLAEPGGICLSDTCHNQVFKHVTLQYRDAGFKRLKNIPQAVRVYKVNFFDEEVIQNLGLMERKTSWGNSILIGLLSTSLLCFFIIGLMFMFRTQALDRTFFTGEFAPAEKSKKGYDQDAAAPKVNKPTATATGADSGPSLQDLSKTRVDVQEMCTKFAVSTQRTLELEAIEQAQQYLAKLHMGKVGFSASLEMHEAAKTLGYGQGFASIYTDLVESMRHKQTTQTQSSIEESLRRIIDESILLNKLYEQDRYKESVAYYWVMSEGWCAIPSSYGKWIAPTSAEAADMFASRDISVFYPGVSVDFFGAVYQSTLDFEADSMERYKSFHFGELSNHWREFVIEDAKRRHVI